MVLNRVHRGLTLLFVVGFLATLSFLERFCLFYPLFVLLFCLDFCAFLSFLDPWVWKRERKKHIHRPRCTKNI